MSFSDAVLDEMAMELADRFEESQQFVTLSRKEIEAMAMGYVMGARQVLESLGYDIEMLQVIPKGHQA